MNTLIQQIEQLSQINKEEHEKFEIEKKAHLLTVKCLAEESQLLREQKKENSRLSEQISKVEIQKKNLTDELSRTDMDLESVKKNLVQWKERASNTYKRYQQERDEAHKTLKAIYSELEKLIARYNRNNVKEATKMLNSKLLKLSKMKNRQGMETEELENIQMESMKKRLLEEKEALEKRVKEMRQELHRKKNSNKVELEKAKGSKEAELAGLVAQKRETKAKMEEGALVIMEYEEHINTFMSDCFPKYTNINCKICGQAAFKLEHLENISDKEAAFIIEQHHKREAQQVEYPASSNHDMQDD